MDVAQAKKNLAAAQAAAKAAGEEVVRIQRELAGVEAELAKVEDDGEAIALVGRRQAAQNRLRTATDKSEAAKAARQAARLALAEAERDEKRQAHAELRERTVTALWEVRELAVDLRKSDRAIAELDAEVGGYPAGATPPNALYAELVTGIESALVRMGAAEQANGLDTGPILRRKDQAPPAPKQTGIKAMAAQLAAAVVGG